MGLAVEYNSKNWLIHNVPNSRRKHCEPESKKCELESNHVPKNSTI